MTEQVILSAQTAAMLGLLSLGQVDDGSSVYYFVGIDKARIGLVADTARSREVESLLGEALLEFAHLGRMLRLGLLAPASALLCRRERRNQQGDGQDLAHESPPAPRVSSVKICSRDWPRSIFICSTSSSRERRASSTSTTSSRPARPSGRRSTRPARTSR